MHDDLIDAVQWAINTGIADPERIAIYGGSYGGYAAHDVRVRQSESEQIVAALQKKGIPHEYLLFKDEGHGFKRPENRMIFYEAAEKFLEKNMR